MNLENVIAERKTKTIYRDGDSVVKLFNQNYSKADILNEALNQARVEEVGLNIPKILEVTSHEGMWAIRSEFIEGQTLSHLMRDDPENKDRYLEMLVDTQMLIHSRRCPLLSRLKDKMNRKILSADLEPVTRYELLIRLEGLPTHDKLCHGDLCPSNIILTPEGELYIIDWAHATQGKRRSIWTCSARRAERTSAMCRSGCPLWRPPSPSKAISTSGTSCSAGPMWPSTNKHTILQHKSTEGDFPLCFFRRSGNAACQINFRIFMKCVKNQKNLLTHSLLCAMLSLRQKRRGLEWACSMHRTDSLFSG